VKPYFVYDWSRSMWVYMGYTVSVISVMELFEEVVH